MELSVRNDNGNHYRSLYAAGVQCQQLFLSDFRNRRRRGKYRFGARLRRNVICPRTLHYLLFWSRKHLSLTQWTFSQNNCADIIADHQHKTNFKYEFRQC